MRFHFLAPRGWTKGCLSLACGLCASFAFAADASHDDLTEGGYLGELPVVLSVTRLAQSLADTPGAVTIIDRDMIRRSGARQVSELLRFVPGFIVSGWNGANAISSYHARLDEYGSRLQVFIDGRSVYSSLYLGDTHRGLSAVVMEDIERIEVLRGSNSAAYGANAFLGVINIVTRNSADTNGTLVSVTRGDNGIRDETVRYGWGSAEANYRITGSRRSDNGFGTYQAYPSTYAAAPDDFGMNQMHFRGDMRLSNTDDLQFQLGGANTMSGEGDGSPGNAARNVRVQANYAQVRFTRQLSQTESITLSGSFDDETVKDSFQHTQFPVIVDFSGSSRRYNLEFSHTQQPSESLRTVWGTSWRQESVYSPALFYVNDSLKQTLVRLFGNAEWRITDKWLLNIGGMLEHTSVGNSLAPRVMLNYHVVPDHTLRVGVTKATRSPSLYELSGDVRYYDQNTGALLSQQVKSLGDANPERIQSYEMGYLGELREFRLSMDARIFYEKLSGLISQERRSNVSLFPLNDYVNKINATSHGAEYQLNWRPYESTRVQFNNARTYTKSKEQPDLGTAAPRSTYSVAVFQKLPANWDVALMYSYVGPMTWRLSAPVPDYSTLNARVARAFQIGKTRAELALTTQSVSGNQIQFMTSTSGHPIVPVVPRRTFLSLRLEY